MRLRTTLVSGKGIGRSRLGYNAPATSAVRLLSLRHLRAYHGGAFSFSSLFKWLSPILKSAAPVIKNIASSLLPQAGNALKPHIENVAKKIGFSDQTAKNISSTASDTGMKVLKGLVDAGVDTLANSSGSGYYLNGPGVTGKGKSKPIPVPRQTIGYGYNYLVD